MAELESLSAVVQVIDGFSGAPVEGVPVRFTVDGRVVAPLAKPQGYFAFTRLADGAHAVEVEAQGFFPARLRVRVPPSAPLAEAVVDCPLDPTPLYPFPSWATLIRGRIGGAAGQVRIQAQYRDRAGRAQGLATTTVAAGPWAGAYVLALAGRLAAETDVTLSVTGRERTVRAARGRITVLNLDLT